MEKEGRKIVERRAQVWKRWTIGGPHLTGARQAGQYSPTKSRKTAIQRIRFLSG